MSQERWRAWLWGVLPAAALLVIGLGGTKASGVDQPDTVPVDRWAYVLVAGAAVALVLRRRWPVPVLLVVAAASSTYLVLDYPYGPILLSFAVAVYEVGARLAPGRAALAAGAALAALLPHVFLGRGVTPGLFGVVPAAAWVVVPFAVGFTVRVSRESVARANAERARRIADDERLRVAQEVHDVVGHGLAAINMQAEIALHLLPKQPGQAAPALEAISRTSKQALDELRSTLALVRHGESRAPTAGLARLDDLVGRVRDSGVPVEVRTTGEPLRPLPAAVDLTAYRVIQESLTNVLRHAGAATATVSLGFQPGELQIEIVDTARGEGGSLGRSAHGRGAAGPGHPGHGIIGMRERVAAVGGEMTAEPHPGGGFRVYARLPVPREGQ
ncbi:sensor histidine kinase [Micromonospora sp. NPDC047074]|uniref:sensor histidine kinase n=1 Tax=Micromonospora sp. NPDC047074 TaxID=3154339 RepID=UPI003407A220